MTHGKAKTTTSSKLKARKLELEDLVAVFVPSLAAILANAEKKKGAPLTESEVVNIRDTSTVMMVRRAVADEMAKGRGFQDLNSEKVWAEWQVLRTQVPKSK
jgi:hypothetical protein